MKPATVCLTDEVKCGGSLVLLDDGLWLVRGRTKFLDKAPPICEHRGHRPPEQAWHSSAVQCGAAGI